MSKEVDKSALDAAIDQQFGKGVSSYINVLNFYILNCYGICILLLEELTLNFQAIVHHYPHMTFSFQGPQEKGWKLYVKTTSKVLAIFGLLYLFICSLDLMSGGFKLALGKNATSFLSDSELLKGGGNMINSCLYMIPFRIHLKILSSIFSCNPVSHSVVHILFQTAY